jgi:cellulose synthase/poly-beta-1,6-N-acetylglucosamine synthase-like glycosyltransferase
MNMFAARLLFWGCIFLIVYVYFGYPVALLVMGRIRKRPVKKAPLEPPVTIIISAYNEEAHIGATLSNKLSLNYPKGQLQIIVVSDASEDKTDQIVRGFEERGVLLLRQEPRSGKTSALNRAVPAARGEIIVFSDANSLYDADAVRKLVQNFSDPTVGYVTGKMIYTDPDGTIIGAGCSAYMRYENLLRRLETDLGSIVGVDGAIDAVRKELYRPMKPDQLPDFVLPLSVIIEGYRVVYEPEALLKEAALKTEQDEYRMRLRVTLRALWTLRDLRQLLSFKRFGLFAWQLWTHKLLRYLCFLFLAGAYIGNLLLWNQSPFYGVLLLVQSLLYLGMLFPWPTGQGKTFSRLLGHMRYFMLLNLSAAHACLKCLLGRKQETWTPRKG